MKLSVIIPCLNSEATLATQLEALASQQWSQPWELIVADNGSSDNSVEIALKYRKRITSLRVIDASSRKGSAHARNAGVLAASADRFAFCDADDEVAAGWLALMGDALQNHDVVYGHFRFDKFNRPRQAEQAAKQWKNGLYKGRFLPGGGTGNLGINRWVHMAIGGFDENLLRSMDADYYWRLQLEGFELHYLPEAEVQVRKDRVNPTLSYFYRLKRTRAAANYWLYKRYRHLGMLPPQPLSNSIDAWLRTVRNLASAGLKSKTKRAEWQKQFVLQTGELVGQIQGRITNPCAPYHPAKRSLRKD